jgi:hypothetical protein
VSWIQDLWKLVETVATLTKEVERANSDIKELRRDVHTLTAVVAELTNDLRNQKEVTELKLDNYKSEIQHAKETIAVNFDGLASKLELKFAELDRRSSSTLREEKPHRRYKRKY